MWARPVCLHCCTVRPRLRYSLNLSCAVTSLPLFLTRGGFSNSIKKWYEIRISISVLVTMHAPGFQGAAGLTSNSVHGDYNAALIA